MANPPDQAEIDRAVAEFDSIMKQGVQTAAAEQGTDLADMMVGALDIRETTTSAATSYAILTGAEDKKMFTTASVLASTAKIFDGIQRDRKSDVEGQRVSVRVVLGGRRNIKKKHKRQHTRNRLTYA